MFVGEQKGLIKSIVNEKLRLSKNVNFDGEIYVKRYDYML